MVLTALVEFVWAATAAGIAIGLYPVLRKYNQSLALGAVVGRTVEGMLVLVGTVSLLALFTLSQGAGSTAASSSQAVGNALLAVRDWGPLLGSLSFGTAAFIYYCVLYRSRLVPRWLSGWGLIGAGLSIGSTVYSLFVQEFGITTVALVANIPGLALQEMVLAVWLIVRGFKASALASVASAGG
ncbi:MAG: DUF4386 domain-containing protein [Candidatus Dormibacteria bacterium]